MAKNVRSAAEYLPEDRSLPVLREAVQRCRGCDLYKDATQAVFGEIEDQVAKKNMRASVLLVGEGPGNKEDLAGRPFVGPAGQLLDKALEDAGIDRKTVYVTNAVKHFKWEARGKLRVGKKPTIGEVRACHPWLEAELAAMHPKLIVCLGATAAQSLLGPSFKVTKRRGEIVETPDYPPILATIHPSAILRARTSEDRAREMALFTEDLTIVAAHLKAW